jgi:membrane peptidoglycan carboxypeptidase
VPQVVTGVWVGDQRSPQRSLAGVHGLAGFGADMAAPVWTDVMAAATAHLPIEGFPTPPPEKRGTIPNIVGLQKDEAIKALVTASFSPNPVDGPCIEKKGIVCDQTPAAGTTAPLGTSVTFTVSDGTTPPPVKVLVPDEVGKTKDDAVADLTAVGFVVDIQHQDTSDHAQDGIVLDQHPAAGKMADQGSTVTIVVGKFKKGKAPWIPPNPGLPPWGAPIMAVVVVPAFALGVLRVRARHR